MVTAIIIITSLYLTYDSEAESNKLRIWHQLLHPGLQFLSCVTLDKLSNLSEPCSRICGQKDTS